MWYIPISFKVASGYPEHAAGLCRECPCPSSAGRRTAPGGAQCRPLRYTACSTETESIPRHQSLIGIAVIALRDKVMHTEEMGVVANIPADTSLGDTQLFRDFTGILPCNMIQPLRLPDGSHLILAQCHAANILLQPAGHAPLQMRVKIGGEHGAAFVIFSALYPRQKLQRAFAAEVIQNRFRIHGTLIRMTLICHQAVEFRCGFLWRCRGSDRCFYGIAFPARSRHRHNIGEPVPRWSCLLTRLLLRRTAPRIGRSGDPAALVDILRRNALFKGFYGNTCVAQGVIEQVPHIVLGFSCVLL